MQRRLIWGALTVVLLVQVAMDAWLLGFVERTGPQNHAAVLVGVNGPLWAIAVVLVARLHLSPRRATALILGAGAALSIAAFSHSPSTSDDDFRYLWDGRVQLAGVDPYRHAPSSRELLNLREPVLFGPPGTYRHRIYDASTQINRPGVRTIYPPVAEGAFAAIRIVSFGGHGNHLPLQLAGALGLLAIGWVLLRRGPPWRAALWTWCPVPIVEFANNAHIDWLGVLLAVLALTVAGGTIARGVLVGAATAVKIYPALVLPALMRRDWRVALVAVLTVAVVYVPHVLAVGPDVIGYLPGYLQENQYGSGNNLRLLGPVFGDTAGKYVAVIMVGLAALWAWLRAPRDRPEQAAVIVVGVAFLAFTPGYGWYAALLLALAALTGAVEWVPIAFAPTLAYYVHSHHDTLVYGVASFVALLTLVARTVLVRRGARLASLRA